MPARAPLLAWLGLLVCEAVFPSPVVLRRLLSRVPFLVSDLGCLVCTVQIKVVSMPEIMCTKPNQGSR